MASFGLGCLTLKLFLSELSLRKRCQRSLLSSLMIGRRHLTSVRQLISSFSIFLHFMENFCTLNKLLYFLLSALVVSEWLVGMPDGEIIGVK